MTILSSERAREPSGCLLWLIRPSLPWYSRSKSLYDSQRQLRIAEGGRGGAAHSPGIADPKRPDPGEPIMQSYHL